MTRLCVVCGEPIPGIRSQYCQPHRVEARREAWRANSRHQRETMKRQALSGLRQAVA